MNVSVTASDLQAYSESFGTLTAEAHMQNQVVQLDSLSLNKPESGQLQASGRYDTTSRKYEIKADGKELKLNRVVLPQGTTISANLSVSADGSGTLENPGGVLGLSVRDLQLNDENTRTDRYHRQCRRSPGTDHGKRSFLWTCNKCLCQYRASISGRGRNSRYGYGYLTASIGAVKGALRPCERNCKCFRGPQRYQ